MLVEGLEARDLMTILFTPQQGTPVISDGGGDKLGQRAFGMPLYSIFWGSYWATPDGQAQQATLENSLDMIFTSATLSGLNQYGVPFPARVPSAGTVEVNDFSDPPDGFTKSNLDHVLTNAIDNLGLPEEDDVPNGGFTLIFTPPNINAANGAAAFHTSTTDFDFPFDFDTWHYAWIGNFNSQDSITNSISHEVMEAMTDPNGDGIQILPRDSHSFNEICDNEAQNFAALVAGYEVASFWSAADNAFAVYDGNSQVVTYDNGNLIVNGDQFGADTDDTITVDLNNEGQPLITLNGQTFSFTSDPFIDRVTSITINPGGGTNTINVERTNFLAPVSIVGSSRDTVNIGVGGSTQGIQGNVTIENPPSFTTINVDDSADTAQRGVILSTFTPPGDSAWGSLDGLAPAEISYEFADTSSITINTGASATIDVLSTGVSTSLVGHGSTTVNVGEGGSVQGIFGALNISNPPSFTTINVDDSADTTARSATLDTFTASDGSSWGSITGLAPASINYKQADTSSPITISGGSGADTFTVASLPVQAIDLNTGAGNDTVTLQTNSGGLVVNGQGGTNTLVGPNAAATWNITNTNAGNITGVATFTSFENLTGGSGADTFKFSNGKSISGRINGGGGADTLDYSLFSTGVTVKLGVGTATGTGSIANIENVTGSRANDSITGSSSNNVIKGQGGTDVLNGGGGGSDTFFLAPSQGAGTTVTGAGTTDTLVGANIPNTWNITGNNSGNVNGIAFTGIANLLGGSGADTFKFTSTGSLSGKVDGGSGGMDTLDYSADGGTAVTVNLATHTATKTGGFANIDRLVGSTSTLDKLIGPNLSSTWMITGANSGSVGAFNFSSVENLTGGSAADMFKFTSTGSLTGTVDGGSGGTDTLDYSADGGTAVTVNLATHTATKTGGFANIDRLVGSTSTLDKLVGPNLSSTWMITGANSGSVGAFSFSSVENLTGGSAADMFKFTSTGSLTGTVDGGSGGTDTLDYSADGGAAATVNLATHTATRTGGFANIDRLVGSSSAADKLIGPDATTIWAITTANAGTAGTFAFSAIENLTGGTGIDEFVFSAGQSVSGKIDGGTGADNWLDYARYTTGVAVDLTANSATGVNGGAVGGIANIRNVRGGLGSDTLKGNSRGNILIGGPSTDTHNDRIIGGSGRSILIGGKGGDSVLGGSADDIVIGGFTNFDNSGDANDQALEAILAEWRSADSYTTRITKIKAGVGPMLAKFVFGTTVHDDGNSSTLTGGPGSDWFFKGAHDTATDKATGEQVN
jgi:hypothetical protein